MTTPPTTARAQVINTAINSMLASGVWTKMGLLYVCAAETQQAGQLNWIAPGSNTLSLVSAPTFTTDRGFAGDGLASYLDTGTLLTAVTGYSQNAAHLGVWGLAGNATAAFGTGTSLLATAGVGSTRPIRVNAGAPVSTTADPTTGHVVAVRRDSANVFSYRNGGTEVTGASASSAVSAVNLNIDRTNTTSFATVQVASAHAGNQLSAAEVLALYNSLRAYLTAVGAP